MLNFNLKFLLLTLLLSSSASAQNLGTIPTDRILGRDSPGQGQVEKLTPSQARSVLNLPEIWITNYGGVCDGSTDNTPAMTAAVAALPSTGGTIHFPACANFYKFNSTVSIQKPNVHIIGEGVAGGVDNTQVGSVLWKFYGTGDFVHVGNAADHVVGFEMSNINLDGRIVADRNLHFTDVQRFVLKNLYIKDAIVTSVVFDNNLAAANPTGWGKMDHVIITQKGGGASNTANGIHFDGSGATGVSMIDLNFVEVIHVDGDAILLDQGDGLVFTKPYVFRNPGGTGRAVNITGSNIAINSVFIYPIVNELYVGAFLPTGVNVIVYAADNDATPFAATGPGAESVTIYGIEGNITGRASETDSHVTMKVSDDFIPNFRLKRINGDTFTDRELYIGLSSIGGWSFVDVTGGLERYHFGYDGNATFTGSLTVPTEVYDATNWNGDLTVPTKDAVRDKIETLGGGSVNISGTPANDQLSIWTDASTIEGDAGLTFDTSTNILSVIGTIAIDDQNELRWLEEDAGGSNYVTFSAPATLASNRTCVFQDSGPPIPDSCVGDGTDNSGAGGTVSAVGTPVDNQIAVWTGVASIEGDAAFTFDTATDVLSVGGTIELSHATQNTLSASAGVLSIEGVALLTSTSADALFLTPAEGNAAYQPLDADLTSWALITRTAAFDTLAAATANSAALRAYLSDEIGTGVLVFLGTPADDQVPVGDSASATTWRTVADSDAATQKLQYDQATNTFSAGTDDDVPDSGDFTNLTGGTGIVNTAGTLSFDATEITPTVTWGAGSFTTMTFDAGASDIAFETATGTITVDIGGTNETTLTTTAFSPGVDAGSALGTTALAWNDIFLDTGATINIESGDWLATHTTGILTIGTGTLKITTPTNNTTSVLTTDGTQTVTNKSIVATQITAGALNIGNNAFTTGTIEMANGTANTLSATGGVLSIEGVALQTAITNYVATVADGTGIDGTATGAASTYTPSFDATELTGTTTFGAGAAVVVAADLQSTDDVIVGDDIAMIEGASIAWDTTDCVLTQTGNSLDTSGCTISIASLATITLGTDTAGNYVDNVTGGSGITVTHTPAEGSEPDVVFDATEINSLTWGSGTFTTVTFNAGAVDPVLTFGSGTLTYSSLAQINLDDELELRFFEEDTGGANYVGFKAPAALTASVTCTFENDSNPIPDSCVGDGTDAGAGGGLANVVEDTTPQLGGDLDTNDFQLVDAGTSNVLDISTNGLPTFTVDASTGALTIRNDDDGANGTGLYIASNSASPVDDDLISYIVFQGEDDAAANTDYAAMLVYATDVAAATKSGYVYLDIMASGTTETAIQFVGNNETVSLGSGWGLEINEDEAFTTPLMVRQTHDGGWGAFMMLDHESDSPTAGDEVASITFAGRDTLGTFMGYGNITVAIVDAVDPGEDGKFTFKTTVAGTENVVQAAYGNGVIIGTSTTFPGNGDILTDDEVHIGNADTSLDRSAGGELTLEGDAVKHAGKQMMFIPAGAFKANATNGATCGATFDSGSNDLTINTCQFADGATELRVDFGVAMPKAWNEGTITYEVLWTAASGSGTFQAEVGCVAISNDDPLNATVGTTVTQVDTLTTTGDLHVTPESSAITIAGTPAENDYVQCRLSRDTSVDTIAATIEVIGIKVYWTDNASTLAE